jgi:hypothetical protein
VVCCGNGADLYDSDVELGERGSGGVGGHDGVVCVSDYDVLVAFCPKRSCRFLN